ncbi:MAG: hypothetical protein IJ443_07885 [Firmicutes bacterium]|nr:hypothetical protein [Bacillota bacterium]
MNRNSKLREVLDDPRAVAIIEEYMPGFVEEKAAMMGPVMGMKIGMLLKFPQVSLPKDAVNAILERIDALDAE